MLLSLGLGFNHNEIHNASFGRLISIHFFFSLVAEIIIFIGVALSSLVTCHFCEGIVSY
jgi:hypothetical protein